jgi:hypothetical protein
MARRLTQAAFWNLILAVGKRKLETRKQKGRMGKLETRNQKLESRSGESGNSKLETRN